MLDSYIRQVTAFSEQWRINPRGAAPVLYDRPNDAKAWGKRAQTKMDCCSFNRIIR
jgi:hypothetical protein